MLSSALQIVLPPCPFPSTFQNPHLLFPRHSFSVSQCIHCVPKPRVAACPGSNCVCRLIPASQAGKQPLRPRPGHPWHNRHTHIKGTDGRGGLEHVPCPEWEWVTFHFLCSKAMCADAGSQMGTSSHCGCWNRGEKLAQPSWMEG